MNPVDIIVTLIMSVGALLMLTGSIGLLRLPDVYCRMHATGKCDTLGESLILLGLIIYQVYSGHELVLDKVIVPAKMLFIILFFFLANPVATHAIMKAAFIIKTPMWTKQGWKVWQKEESR
ncbi:MAG TPA: cation:proton antiporter [Candidatus Methanoperedenaceae archaeon]|nr:cation:proton antiporter [Candidatus Methanoperedenaceae archaeon]